MRSAAELARLVAAGVIPSAAYLALGLWLLRPLRLFATGSERLAVGFVVGSGAASLGILLLRLLDVPIPLPALAAVVLAGIPRLCAPPRAQLRAGEPAGWVRAVDAASIAIALVTLVAALGPETYWDGFEYHLPLAQAWSEGPIRALPGRLDAELRAGVDLLYIPAVAAGEPDAAAAVSACFAAALAALVRAEARRRSSPGAGSLAGLLTLMAPFALANAPSTYVDLGVGAYGFLGLCLADRWNRSGDAAALRACAVLLAFAANAKLHAAVLIPAALALLMLGGRPVPLRLLGGFGAITGLLVSPWLVKCALTSGNPLFPLFASRFGAGSATPDHLALRWLRLSTDLPTTGFFRRPAHYLLSLVGGRNPHLSGQLGALPIALAPLAWHRLSRATGVLVAALAALFALQIAFAPALRFGAPLLPFLAVAAAVGGERLARSGALARGVLVGLLAIVVVHHAAQLGQGYGPRVVSLRDPWRHAGAIFPDQVALLRMVERAPPVVAIRGGAVAWMPKPVYLLDWQRNGELFFDPLLGRQTPPDVALALLRRRGVRSLVLEVGPRRPADGTLGHSTVDAWLRDGLARVRPDPSPPRARGDRLWVQVELLDPPPPVSPAAPGGS